MFFVFSKRAVPPVESSLRMFTKHSGILGIISKPKAEYCRTAKPRASYLTFSGGGEGKLAAESPTFPADASPAPELAAAAANTHRRDDEPEAKKLALDRLELFNNFFGETTNAPPLPPSEPAAGAAAEGATARHLLLRRETAA